jgi:ribosomal protein L37AE/L43A
MRRKNNYCWKTSHALFVANKIKDRRLRAKKKIEQVAVFICPSCGQPVNIRNDAEEIWNNAEQS